MTAILSTSPLTRIDRFCALATTALISAFSEASALRSLLTIAGSGGCPCAEAVQALRHGR
jgi:hypothetical protein